MFGLLFFGFVASALAAPQYGYSNYAGSSGTPIQVPTYNMPIPYNNQWPFTANVFDQNKFLNDMANLRRNMEDMAADLNKRYRPETVYEGNEYKISLPLSGFEKKDITVEAREGIIKLYAYHATPGGGINSYSNILMLPEVVNPNCTWSYDNSVLRIVCTLKEDIMTEQPEYIL